MSSSLAKLMLEKGVVKASETQTSMKAQKQREKESRLIELFQEGLLETWLPNLLRSYSGESAERLLNLLQREYGNLLPMADIRRKLQHEKLLQSCLHVRVLVQGWDLKSSGKGSFKKKHIAGIRHGSETWTDLKNDLFVLLDPDEKVVKFEVFNGNRKTLGDFELSLDGVNSRLMSTCKIYSHDQPDSNLGDVKVVADLMNPGSPSAVDMIRRTFTNALVSELKEFSKENYKQLFEYFVKYETDMIPSQGYYSVGMVIEDRGLKNEKEHTIVICDDKEYLCHGDKITIPLKSTLDSQITIQKRTKKAGLTDTLKKKKKNSPTSVKKLGMCRVSDDRFI